MAQQGNAEVIALLETFLVEAKAGKYGHVAIALCDRPSESVRVSYAGISHLAPVSRDAIKVLAGMIDGVIDNFALPPRDPNLGADHVCYDMPNAPLCYDFLTWLVDATMTMRREGLPGPLKVAFWFGRNGAACLDRPGRRQMFENVMRPMITLVGAVEDDAALLGRAKPRYSLLDIVAAVRNREKLPQIAPSPETAKFVAGSFERAPVTITLRESAWQPHRNSNLDAWQKFARYLQNSGEHVIFVRDTGKATEPLPGFECHPFASVDLDTRVALYAAAKVNLFVSNGPQSLALFMDRPWLAFFVPDPDGADTPNTPSFWRENFGIECGQQLPWCRDDQRFTWTVDDYDNLVAAWQRWIAPAAIAA